MENNKYVKLHSLLRMLAALLAIVIFVSMFIAKQAVHSSGNGSRAFDFGSGAFVGDSATLIKGNFIAFIAYILVLIGGLAGLAFVFIDELIGKELTKTLSFVVGGVMVVSGILIILFFPIFKALNNSEFAYYTTAAAPIVFGILAILAGAINAAAPILEDKGL